MPNQVNGAFLRAPCPVPSCPAYQPNSGSALPSVSTKTHSSRGADIVMQSCRSTRCLAQTLQSWTRIGPSLTYREDSIAANEPWRQSMA